MGKEHREHRTRLLAEEPSDTPSSSSHKWDHLEFLLDILKNVSPVQVAKYWKGCRISFFGDFRTRMDQTDGWCNGDHGISFNVGRTDVYLLLFLYTVQILFRYMADLIFTRSSRASAYSYCCQHSGSRYLRF